MKASAGPGGGLILTHEFGGWPRVMFALAVVLLAVAAYEQLAAGASADRVLGFIGGAAALAGAGLVMFEQARTVVDPRARTISWERRSALGLSCGTLHFDEIDAVIAERPLGDEGVPSRRIVLRTGRGEHVPLTRAYYPDVNDRIQSAANRIRAMVEDARPGSADPIAALVAAGQVIQAITELREREGLSLADAKRRVDALRERR